MKQMKRRGLMLASLTLGACAPTLAGQLRHASGEPINVSDARVNVAPLSGKDGSLVLEVDAAGRFSTDEDLRPGPYLVEALVPGYAISSERIEIGKTETVDLTLRPLAAIKPSVIGTGAFEGAARGAGNATLTPPSF